MKETGVMRHPLLSCVLYLNDAAECGLPPLGATLVMEQRFDAEAQRGVPEPSRRDVLVWPSPNALLVFDGELAHGVLDSASRRVVSGAPGSRGSVLTCGDAGDVSPSETSACTRRR